MSLSRRQPWQAASSASLGAVAGGSLRQSRASAQSGEKEAVTIQFWTHDQNYIDFFTARAAELTELADSRLRLRAEHHPGADHRPGHQGAGRLRRR